MHHTLSYHSVGEVGGIPKISGDKISVKVTDRRNRSPGVYDIIAIFWTLRSLDIIVYLSVLLCYYGRGKMVAMTFSAGYIWKCHVG